MRTKEKLRFIILSLTGIVLFFVPVYRGMIPVVLIVNWIKGIMGVHLEWISAVSCFLLAAELAGGKLFKVPALAAYFKGERVRCVFWSLSAVTAALRIFRVPFPFMEHPQIGGTILTLGSTVFLTIAVAGSLVVFIIQSGIVEFVSVLMEPVMQPLFNLPGEAAVNILSSFVSSASVGVYFTEQYYIKKRYTTRQACSVVTSFSVVSVGYIGVIASVAGIGEQYGLLLVSSFFMVLLMGAIMVRIPPISLMDNRYADGSPQIRDRVKMNLDERFRLAWKAGEEKAAGFSAGICMENFLKAFQFAQKIVGVMLPTVLFVLVLVYYTPLFTWLGYPLIPVLNLLGIPNAAMAAPSVFIGIVEVSLPGILIGGSEAAAQTRFFVALLSIVQIIFFSEAGNAILGSRIPLNVQRLVIIFLVRTAVAIPLAAGLTHILY